jgi:acetyltransferase-like isoleucine patch superfamily enzyme
MVTIGHNVHLSEDTVVGADVTIGNNVTIYPKVTLGDRCTIFDGAVIGRPPKSTATITRQVHSAHQPLLLGEGCVVGANAVLYTGITVGKHTLIGDLATIREGCIVEEGAVIGRSVLVMYDTKIGARSRIIDGAILTGNMEIEADVFIGPGFNSINDNDVYLSRFGLQNLHTQGPVIRRFALLGTGSCIAADVEIGMGAIVAPNAMVTRDVAAWTVVAGVPARHIRDVSTEEKSKILKHFRLEDSQ